jgi:hypothetical protein
MNPRVKYTLIHGMIKAIDHANAALFELHEFEEFDKERADYLVNQFGKVSGFGQASAELFLSKGEHQ